MELQLQYQSTNEDSGLISFQIDWSDLQPNQVKKFKDYSVAEFLRFVTNHPLVEDLVEHEKPVVWGRGY